ncbi:MAG TPA: TrbG/VirB9 family P-type conjugative transfer protein [Croceibacterium sp.]|nr:TrbG/VirB9 family P-type conjugative transfer protein [Croceibacterium sp.]
MRLAVALLLSLAPAAVAAQVAPTPGFDDPRLQTVAYDPARPVRLVAFPGANLTVILMPGDRIAQTVISDPSAFDVKVTGAQDSLNIAALRPDAAATLLVDTPLRRYEFDLDTGDGLAAAYVVRFVDPTGVARPAPVPPAQALTGEYRLSGEETLLPTRIGDDGERTYIEWGKYQSLPAVFGIGNTGQEEVVDGYMREGVFTIDRVYGELVFRVDKKRARARRRGGLG